MPRRRFRSHHRSLLVLALAVGLIVWAISLVTGDETVEDHRRIARQQFASQQYLAAVMSLDRAMEQAAGEVAGRELTRLKAEILAERGACNLRLGRPESCLNDLREARSLQPGQSESWWREGAAFLELKRYLDAALLLEEASLQFSDREKEFRYAAGVAYFREYRRELDAVLEALVPLAAGKQQEYLEKQLRRFAAAARDAAKLPAIEEAFLPPPHDTPTRLDAYEKLRGARRALLRADELLATYDTDPDLDPALGVVRVELHFIAGRVYEGKRLALVLLESKLPDADQAIALHGLLANALHQLGEYAAAAAEFLILRRTHQLNDQGSEARRAMMFAVEELLRARDGAAASDQMLRQQMRDDNPLSHFYSGYATYLTGRSDRMDFSIVKAFEIFNRDSFRGAWFRDDEHRLLVFTGMVECLIQLRRLTMAVDVLGAGLSYFPEQIGWARQRAHLLRSEMNRPEDLLEQDLRILRSGVRTAADLEIWEADAKAHWKNPARLEQEVTYQTRRILQRYETGGDEISLLERLALDEMGGRGKGKKAKDRKEGALVDGGSILLGGLRNDVYISLQVYRYLIAENHRSQAYLLLFALAEKDPTFLQLSFLLAQHDHADGSLLRAAGTWYELYERNPADFESGLHAWQAYRRAGERSTAQDIERAALARHPDSFGRLLAILASLEDGYPEIAVRIGSMSELQGELGASQVGAYALALLGTGDPRTAELAADSALQLDPSDPYALVAKVEVLRAGSGDDWNPALNFLQENRAALQERSVEELLTMGHLLLRKQLFAPAERVLRVALQIDSHHVPVRLALVDSLLGMERFGEAEDLLAQLEESRDVIRRRTLLRLFTGGADRAYLSLRTVLGKEGEERQEFQRWIAITGAASGRLSTALRSLKGLRGLPPDLLRFLTAAVELRPAGVTDNDLSDELKGMRKRLRSAAAVDRDRELDRFISLSLQPGEFDRLAAALVPVLLLRDVPDFEPLLLEAEQRALRSFPMLGSIARDAAVRLRRLGQHEEALTTLLTQIAQDAGDDLSLQLLMEWSEDLTREQIQGILGGRLQQELPEGIRLYLLGLQQSASSASAAAMETFSNARAAMERQGPALVAQLRLREREILRLVSLNLDGNPYSRFGAQQHLAELRAAFDAELAAVLESNDDSDDVVRFVVEYLDRRGSLEHSGSLLSRLADGLLAHPGRHWQAYRLIARVLRDAAPDAAPLEELGSSLQEALKQITGPAPLESVEALAYLAEGLRARGSPDAAESLLRLAEASCPHHAPLLVTRARMLAEVGDLDRSLIFFQKAVSCGERRPEILTQLAEEQLHTRLDFPRAAALAGEALQNLETNANAEIRTQALSLRAKVAYVRGDLEGSERAWEEVARNQGEDPSHSLPIALQTFASGDAKAARDLLSHQLKADVPHRLLVRALLDTITSGNRPRKEKR